MSSKKSGTLLKSSMYLSIALVLCKVIAFLRDAILSRQFGASIEVDAFLASATLITLFTNVITSSLGKTFITYLAKYNDDQTERGKFIGKTYIYALIIGVLAAGITIIFSDGIIGLILPGFDAEARELLKLLLYIQSPCIVVLMLRGVNRGVLQYNGRFAIIELLNYLGVALTILYLLALGSNADVVGMSIAFTVGSVLTFVIQFIIICKDRVLIYFSIKPSRELRLLGLSLLAYSVAGCAREINVLVEKSVASLIGEGSISLLSYAQKLTVTEVGLISAAICTVSFAFIAKSWAANDKERVKESITSSANMINVCFFFLAAFSMVFRYEIVGFIYGGGDFTQENVIAVGNAMMFYSIGLYGYGFQDVFTYTLNATKQVKYSIGASITGVAINVSLNLLLYQQLGINASAIASACSVVAVVIPLYIICSKKVVSLKDSGLIKETGKLYAASALCGAIGYFGRMLLKPYISSDFLMLLIAGIVLLIGYILLLLVLRSTVIKTVVATVKGKLHRKTGV